MKTITLLFVALITLQSVHASEHSGHSKADHEHESHHSSGELTLNHGHKWKMDDHTRKMFNTMKHRLNSKVGKMALGKLLNDDLQLLIKGCTMTGEAHDQLHVFLNPYMSAVKELTDTGSDQAFQQVKQALTDYSDYFE